MNRWLKIATLALATVAVLAVLSWFQPWRLFTQSAISEPAPTAPLQSDSKSDSGQKAHEPEAAELTPLELARGEFISHEHETTGVVRIIELEDGTRVLRLEGFATSDGPDLEVWLSDAPVVAGFDGWFLADDGEYLSLGKLKATQGDQNYEIPEGVDLSRFSSMSIWCVRFAVSFGAAELLPVS